MSSGSKSLHSSAVPVFQWAHPSSSSGSSSHHPSNPSSHPDSDDPNQKPAQQQPEAVVPENEAVDFSAQPRNLQPRKPRTPPGGDVGGAHRNVRKVRQKKKEKLCVSLTKEEIEEDLYSMTGEVATRRPKRRPKSVQKELDKLFPGLCLDGTSADTYRAV